MATLKRISSLKRQLKSLQRARQKMNIARKKLHKTNLANPKWW